MNPLEHILPHPLLPGGPTWLTNHLFMTVLAALLMLLIFPLVFRRADAGAPHGVRNFFEAILEFLRVEVFRPALKEHTDRFLPFLWSLFFFVLLCNFLGWLPMAEVIALLTGGHVVYMGGTATGNFSVTAGLAICSFICIHVSGVIQVFRSLHDGTYGHHAGHDEHSSNGQPGHEAAVDLEHMRGEALAADVPQNFGAVNDPTGHYADGEHPHPAVAAAHAAAGMAWPLALILASPLYLWNFAPHPLKPAPGASVLKWIPDFFMWALLLVLELIGAAIKPFALAIRLFANMIAGHIILATLVGLIIVMPTLLGQVAVGIPVMLLSELIRALELFVVFLQAYIFTFLTTLFIASAVAPEH